MLLFSVGTLLEQYEVGAIQLCIDITVKSYTLTVSYYHHAETRPVLGFLCLFLLSFLHIVYITRIVSIDCHTFVFKIFDEIWYR